jgi:putative hydrolase
MTATLVGTTVAAVFTIRLVGGSVVAWAYDALVSDPGPFGADDDRPDPFRGMPIFGDLAKVFGAQLQGPTATWDAARQWALSIASDNGTEPNVDPAARNALEELSRVAELHVSAVTGLPTSHTGGVLRLTAITRAQWATHALDAYRPYLERLSGSLGQDAPEPAEPDPGDPMAFLGPLVKLVMPMMAGLTIGSMVGNLAQRAFGAYTLPIPRPGDEIGIVTANVDAFGTDWSLPLDDLRLWICIHEVAHHAVLRLPHVQARFASRLEEYLASFEPDPGGIEERLNAIDPMGFDPMRGPMALFGDPEVLLGALRSPRQDELLPEIEALVSVVVGYVDHVVERVGQRLLASYGPLTEALCRRRVEAAPADRLVEHLLGLELGQPTYDRGQAFVAGVLERAGDEGLARLWHSDRELPTPAEVDAPGLWLARIDIPE